MGSLAGPSTRDGYPLCFTNKIYTFLFATSCALSLHNLVALLILATDMCILILTIRDTVTKKFARFLLAPPVVLGACN